MSVKSLKFGLLMHPLNTTDWDRFRSEDWSKSPDIPDGQIWDEMKACGLQAEPLGFDSLWITEHHVTPYGLCPDPLQAMTYFAGHSDQISLGTAVVVLPWHHPIRVAEQIAMLSNLAPGRRLQIGFGRGVAQSEFAHLGVDQNTSRERFDEGVEIIKAALTQDPFSYDGQIFQVPETHLRPHLRDPIVVDDFLCAFGSPTSLRQAASRGLRPAFTQGKPAEEIHDDVVRYNSIRIENGYEPVQPVVAQWLFCAETEEEAWDGALRYMGMNGKEIDYHYNAAGWADELGKIKGYEHYAELGRTKAAYELDEATKAQMFAAGQVWGTPEMCIEKLSSMQELTSAEELICQFKYGGMPLDVAQKSLTLFAKEVLPALKEMPATFYDWARKPSLDESVSG